MLTTTLRSWEAKALQVPNAVIAASGVHNLSRSPNGVVEIVVTLPFTTPVSMIKRLAAAVLEHTRRNRTSWSPSVDSYIYSLDRTRGFGLGLWLTSTHPLSNSRQILIDASAVKNMIRMFLINNKVKWVDSEIPVRISPEEQADAPSAAGNATLRSRARRLPPDLGAPLGGGADGSKYQ